MAQIYAFGDSITYGSWDTEYSGWANRLRLYFDQKTQEEDTPFTYFYNLGIPGENTDSLVKRFQSETEIRFRKNEDYTFLFAFGANDACFTPSKGEFQVPVERYKQNLDSVINQAKEIASKVFILNITPVVDELTVAPIGKDKSRLNKYIEPYNQAVSELAQKNSIQLIDVHSAFMQHDLPTLFCEDGLHPNAKGHEIIFDLMKRSLNIV
ncbi:MAG TPA: GDSL-type esterase/lipase family protein [Patescibacteria group bacterium]